MLEQLFGSKTRVRLLRLLLNNPGQPFYLREISRRIKIQLNSVRREIINLEKIGIVQSVEMLPDEGSDVKASKAKKTKKYKKYYLISSNSVIYPELKAMFLKGQLLLEKSLIKEIEKIAQVRYLALTGSFVGFDGTETDLLLIGRVNKNNIKKIIKKFERELDRQINYTVMSVQEYKYRHDITDKFLYDILEGKKIVIVDKLNK